MFDFDVGKLVVIGAVALVVIGPKDLPRVLRQVGQAVGKMRRMATEFQSQFMEAMREADVADVKKEVESLAESAKFDVNFDPLKDVRTELSTVETQLSQVNADVAQAIAAEAVVPEAIVGDTVPHAPDVGTETATLDDAPALAPPTPSVVIETHTPALETPAPAQVAAQVAAQEILEKIRPQVENAPVANESRSAVTS